ncbi:hypothetical protein CEXT_565131 [Caerostris extrusa]|uniref:Uncharacterized protein n=1 Tax=Caerostris extrusa TaxID=172846 RepID=A0AAV4WTE4_CAEEX|nr:hypothetical protein CEXT_565131 [Caerostris extrusa]
MLFLRSRKPHRMRKVLKAVSKSEKIMKISSNINNYAATTNQLCCSACRQPEEQGRSHRKRRGRVKDCVAVVGHCVSPSWSERDWYLPSEAYMLSTFLKKLGAAERRSLNRKGKQPPSCTIKSLSVAHIEIYCQPRMRPVLDKTHDITRRPCMAGLEAIAAMESQAMENLTLNQNNTIPVICVLYRGGTKADWISVGSGQMPSRARLSK